MGMANEDEFIRQYREQAFDRLKTENAEQRVELGAIRAQVQVADASRAAALQALEAAKATLTRGAAALEYVNLAIEALGG